MNKGAQPSNLPLEAVKLSIVTTLFKSSDYVEDFYRRASAEARKITDDFEVIMVDDGSPDNSLERAVAVATDGKLKVIELSRNFGHHKAMMTGIEYARGEYVFLIDVDLEEPPELLGEFYARLTADNLDVVYGYQTQRKGNTFEKVTGAVAWWLVDILLPTKIPTNHSTVRLMRRPYTRALVRHKEQKTAIGGLWVLTGFKQEGIAFNKSSRKVTSYKVSSRMIMLLDSITSFSERPLYIIFFLGLGIMLLAGVVALCVFIQWCSGHFLPGWISIMSSIWLLGGLSIFSTGVVGLYTSRIFIETKERPYTIIRQVYKTGSDSYSVDDVFDE